MCFSCEFCEIFNDTFFNEHLRKTASISKTKILPWNDHLKIKMKTEFFLIYIIQK